MDAIEHIVETPSGLVGIGYVNATDENNTFYTEGEGYITFFDSDGNKTSGRIIDPQMSQAYRIYRINNNLIISGLTPGAEDYALMKTNLNGEKDWIKIYGGDNKDHCFAMDISSDNSIYLSGHTLSNVDNWDSYTMKIDLDGNKLWEKKRGNPRGFDPKYIHDEVWDLKATSDGGCIIVAGTGDEYAYEGTCSQSKDISNVWQVYLIKFSASGEIECLDAMEAMANQSIEMKINLKGHDYYLWQVIFKYLWRFPYKKDPLTDIEKLLFYLKKLKNSLETQNYENK